MAGGLWDLIGITANSWRVGLAGFLLKNNGGNAEIKNLADNAYKDLDAANITARTALKILLGSYTASITHAITANRAYTLPNISGEIVNDATTPDVCNVRIQIANGDAPQGTSSNLQIVALNDGYIKLWDTTVNDWVRRKWTSVTNYTASSFVSQTPFVPIDVFLYWNGSAITLFTKEWQPAIYSKSVTNITNASPPVVTVGSGHLFSVNDIVVLQGVTGGAAGLSDQMYRIIATASTTVTLGTLDGSNVAAPGGTSTNGTLYIINYVTSRFSLSLTTKDGRAVYDNGSGNYYRHIGTIAYGAVKDQFVDSAQFPFIWNRYNQRMRWVSTIDTNDNTVTWTASTTNQTPTNARAAGNRYNDRVWLLFGDANQYIDCEVGFHVLAPSNVSNTSAYNLFLALNNLGNFATSNDYGERMELNLAVNASAGATSVDYIGRMMYAPFRRHVAYAGLNWLQPMEFIYNSGTNTWMVYKNFKSVVVNSYFYKGGIRGAYLR